MLLRNYPKAKILKLKLLTLKTIYNLQYNLELILNIKFLNLKPAKGYYERIRKKSDFKGTVSDLMSYRGASVLKSAT